MEISYLLKGSVEWTILFFVLVAVAVVSQLNKRSLYAAKSGPVSLVLVPFLKAMPALFLAGLTWYLHVSPLVVAGFLFCALGDIFLELADHKYPKAFNIGVLSFAGGLVVFSTAYLGKPLGGYYLFPLVATNVLIGIYILRWLVPKLTGLNKILNLIYFGILIVSNVISSTSTAPIFLGSSLWLMSDLSIGLGESVSDAPSNSLDTLGVYDLGLYFLAIGFLV